MHTLPAQDAKLGRKIARKLGFDITDGRDSDIFITEMVIMVG
jgi:hypothetical protein